VTRTVRRVLVLLAGVTGLLALTPAAAQAYITYNHAEPPRSSG
jgi:hypothetical protein